MGFSELRLEKKLIVDFSKYNEYYLTPTNLMINITTSHSVV
jgi:hypothetical protein